MKAMLKDAVPIHDHRFLRDKVVDFGERYVVSVKKRKKERNHGVFHSLFSAAEIRGISRRKRSSRSDEDSGSVRKDQLGLYCSNVMFSVICDSAQPGSVAEIIAYCREPCNEYRRARW